MNTTTVHLDDEDQALLDILTPEYGGPSEILRQAIRQLAEDRQRQIALAELLAEWEAEDGPLDEAKAEAIAQRYGLGG